MHRKTWFAVVVFGVPAGRWRSVFDDLAPAIIEASRVRGTGTCTNAQVWECSTRALARSADISMLVPGSVVKFSL